jgi:flagellar biosynthetic protein FliP
MSGTASGLAAGLAQASTTTVPLLESLRLSTPVEVFLLLSALSFIPVVVIALTTFTRNVVVLSFLRQGLGLQQTPPNIVLITLALFLTLFSMAPVVDKAYVAGISPYLEQRVDVETGIEQAWEPFRDFLLTQTRESDLAMIHEMARVPLPKDAAAVRPLHLVPAFMLSELKTAFQIGFVILLPFLLIDLVVAAVLMSLGMIMVPPATLSLPIKIMLFIVVDGWGLIARTLMMSAAA